MATQTVLQSQTIRKSGVLVLSGYGIRVYVNAGHLVAHDGIADERRTLRLPRVGHGLRRLIVIGQDGFISFEALVWLADQDAAFIMLKPDGRLLVATGPVRSSDARLRRAQALAHHSGTALQIAKDLLDKKLFAQEQLVREKLRDSRAADRIAETRRGLPVCQSVDALRVLESLAAKTYWGSWRNVPVNFPARDLPRIPEHWRVFGTRISPLTSSPRLAVNPANCLLNFLYALLESEARLALAALGLDPGLGVMHMDSPSRDSLAADVMEPLRPRADSYLCDWLTRSSLRREWFSEQPNGNCRLTSSLAQQLSETASTWASAVAPIAEQVARTFSASVPKRSRPIFPSTRLTHNSRREGRGIAPNLSVEAPPRPDRLCRNCGKSTQGEYCGTCSSPRDRLINGAKLGRIATHTPKAEALRGATQSRQRAAERAWNPADLPEWLTEEVYREKIQPLLATVKVRRIMSALGVSRPYAAEIGRKKRVPHPRHWHALTQIVGIAANERRPETECLD